MTDKVDAYVSQAHYEAHLRPILDALPDEIRGNMYAPQNVARDVDGPCIMGTAPSPSSMPLLCAGYQDLIYGRRPKVLVNHGAGQCYRNLDSPSYAGGPGHELADLILTPNERSADLERARYPRARVVAVGCTKLDGWSRVPHPHNDPPVVAVTFHWEAFLRTTDGSDEAIPEAGWAWPDWRERIADLARQLPGQVLGHGHPRAQRWLRAWWDEMGVEFVPLAEDLLHRADVLVLDNSSLGYEWAALDRPTVWLRGNAWRPNDVCGHGLRFGEPLPGPELWASAPLEELVDAVNTSMQRFVLSRELVATRVYGQDRFRSAERAAQAVISLIGDTRAVPSVNG